MRPSKVVWIFIGDAITLMLVTVYGFATHETLGTAGTRLLTTFIPLLVAWLLIAPHLGVYRLSVVSDFRQLWRPFWAMVLAGPFAAWMRAAWLGTAILPLFVVILGGVSALALLAWRFLYWVIITRVKRTDG
jgi:hypothetical protein